MKILTRKKQEEILSRLSANSIIYLQPEKNMEDVAYFADNAAEIAYLVGGIDGMAKVLRTVSNR